MCPQKRRASTNNAVVIVIGTYKIRGGHPCVDMSNGWPLQLRSAEWARLVAGLQPVGDAAPVELVAADGHHAARTARRPPAAPSRSRTSPPT
jgi:hypothetical protein